MKKKELTVIGRVQAAERLGLSPQALSCHITRRAWEKGSIPAPIKIGGRWKFVESLIDEFLINKIKEGPGQSSSLASDGSKKNSSGRPKKRRSEGC